MTTGHDWKHGYIPLTPRAMRSKNHGRPVKSGSWVTRLSPETARTHAGTSKPDTGRETSRVMDAKIRSATGRRSSATKPTTSRTRTKATDDKPPTGEHEGVTWSRERASNGKEFYRLTYKGETRQTMPQGRTPEQVASEMRHDVDVARPKRNAEADAAQRQRLAESMRIDFERERQRKENNPLGYFEVTSAYQRQYGRQPPKSVLNRWAHSGVNAEERNSDWYQAALKQKGGPVGGSVAQDSAGREREAVRKAAAATADQAIRAAAGRGS
jgi:hypothetical protein